MPMGPVTLNDLVGLDTSLYAGRVVNTAFADRAQDDAHPRRAGGRRPAGPEVGGRLLQLRQGLARRRRSRPSPRSWRRCRTGQARDRPGGDHGRLFLPMLTEASRVLTEGIVREPGDVDMGLILGIGFPPFRGGLLRWADTLGLGKVLEKLQSTRSSARASSRRSRCGQLAAEGKGFYPA